MDRVEIRLPECDIDVDDLNCLPGVVGNVCLGHDAEQEE